MASFSSEHPAPDMEIAIRMLERGQELLIQLRCLLLLRVPPETLPESSWVLQDDISDSLGLALSVLRNWEQPRELCYRAAQSDRSPFPNGDLNSKGSSQKRKSVSMVKGEDDRKKRRNAYSSTKVTAAPYDDGYLWRKYGQKVIRGAKHPRCYFRCTYNSEQDCPATKQVQQTENDDPPMFLIIYTHEHTCKNGQSAPRVIVESTDPLEQFSLSFVPTKTTTPRPHLPSSELGEKQENHYETSATPPAHALFSESDLWQPMRQFWMDTPDVEEAQPIVMPPSPQISEIERFMDSLFKN